MEYISFRCDSCGQRIEDCDVPLVTKEVVGLAPGVQAVLDVTDAPLPQRIRDLLANPRQHIHRCIQCRAWEYGEDLLDSAGVVVVRASDYQNLTDFKNAATTAAQTLGATRSLSA